MKNDEIVKAYLQCWAERDLDRARNYLSQDCVFSDPLLGNLIDAATFMKKSAPFVDAIEQYDVLAVVESDSWTAAYYTVTLATLRETRFSEWFRIEDGKIIEGILMYDTHYIKSAAG